MRVKLMDLIVEKLKNEPRALRESHIREVLKRMEDTNLIAFAIDLGIDTDAVLEVK